MVIVFIMTNSRFEMTVGTPISAVLTNIYLEYLKAEVLQIIIPASDFWTRSWLVPALVFLIMVATVTSQFQASKHDISKICKRMRINCSFRIPHICCVFGRSPQVTYGKSSASQR
nr:uncharacterized protein LOC128689703 [Cherax quadricarinatus]